MLIDLAWPFPLELLAAAMTPRQTHSAAGVIKDPKTLPVDDAIAAFESKRHATTLAANVVKPNAAGPSDRARGERPKERLRPFGGSRFEEAVCISATRPTFKFVATERIVAALLVISDVAAVAVVAVLKRKTPSPSLPIHPRRRSHLRKDLEASRVAQPRQHLARPRDIGRGSCEEEAEGRLRLSPQRRD